MDDKTHLTIVPSAEGVTAVILAMIFVCLIFPHMVRGKRQFYAAVVAECCIVLLHTLTVMLHSDGFSVFTGAMTGFLQIMAIIMIVMSVGGLTTRELASDIKGAYEVMRRGETEKEVIIPIGDQPIPRPMPPVVRHEEPEKKVYSIDDEGNDLPLKKDE
jgi:hypothetical protein